MKRDVPERIRYGLHRRYTLDYNTRQIGNTWLDSDGVAVDPRTNTAYVANSDRNSATVSVIRG